MISFANVDLLVPTPELEEWVKKFLAYEQSSPFQIFYNDVCQYFPQPFPNSGMIKLNSLFWPRDAGRWSFGFFLATTAQLDAINATINTAYLMTWSGSGTVGSGSGNCICSGSGSGSGYSGSGYSGGSYIGGATLTINNDDPLTTTGGISCQMYMLPPIPIARVPKNRSITSVDANEGIWLITLVDERYFWDMRMPSSDTISALTWSSLYSSFFYSLSSATLSTQQLSTSYGDLPSTFYTIPWQAQMSQYYDCMLYQTQRRLVKYLNGDYAILGPSYARVVSASNSLASFPVLAGGGQRKSNILSPEITQTSIAALPHKECSDLRYAIPKGITFTYYDGTQDNYWTQYNPFVSPSQANRFKTFSMRYQASSAYYQEFAKDWFQWKRGYVDMTLGGIQPYTPTGFEDYIEFHYSKDLSYTRIYSGAFNDQTSTLFNCMCNTRKIVNAVTSITCSSGSGSGSGLQVGTEPIIVPF